MRDRVYLDTRLIIIGQVSVFHFVSSLVQYVFTTTYELSDHIRIPIYTHIPSKLP